MKDHEIILKLIEKVDPTDTAKLDEIDARVYLFLNPSAWEAFERSSASGKPVISVTATEKVTAPEYTRSRDALKEIRPEGWGILIRQTPEGNDCFIHRFDLSVGNKNIHRMPTEELAELHAIIQAVAYDREAR